MTPRAERRPWVATLLINALVGLSAAASPSPARAEPLPAALSLRDGRVAADVELAPALPRELEERLGNGLRNLLSVIVAVVPAEGEPTVAVERAVEVLFDVWESRWEVRVRDEGKPAARRETVADAAALRTILGRAADVELGPPAGLPAGPFVLEIRLDLNPISPELLARTREHLSGASRPGGGARSVLGAVAGFLLREPDESAGSYRFRTVPLVASGVRP